MVFWIQSKHSRWVWRFEREMSIKGFENRFRENVKQSIEFFQRKFRDGAYMSEGSRSKEDPLGLGWIKSENALSLPLCHLTCPRVEPKVNFTPRPKFIWNWASLGTLNNYEYSWFLNFNETAWILTYYMNILLLLLFDDDNFIRDGMHCRAKESVYVFCDKKQNQKRCIDAKPNFKSYFSPTT